ncbi:hypothetical protein LCGC14_1009240 [marine sediment metagenome]|uniref:CMP/dCMP-type deaminase domain-containing protein n=1 Tax=marine sediment metagenome TaxID=412755 RepID=A0A0F9N0U0_9ZZZZ
MKRKTRDQYYLDMVDVVATNSTCPRRAVGAIITDVNGIILGVGYNGVPRNYPHCIDHPCPGAEDPSGDSKRCHAVHAEVNAVLHCLDMQRAYSIYCSTFACFECIKMLLNTPVYRYIFKTEYPDREGVTLLAAMNKEIRLGEFTYSYASRTFI